MPRFKKRVSLAAKFNILTIGLILATAAGICLFLIRQEMTNYYNELLNHGKIIADTTVKNCELGIYTESRVLLLPILERLSADSEIAYVSVMNRQHRVLASRVFKGASGLADYVGPISDSSTEILHRELVDERDGRRYIEVLCPLVSGSANDVADILSTSEVIRYEPTVIGFLRLGLTQEGLQRRIRQLIISITLFTSALVLIGAGLTVLLSRRITSPLKRLTAATHDISQGKYDTPFKIRTHDEISDLAKSFDHMRERLRETYAQLEERIGEEQRLRVEKEKLMMDLHDGIGGITTNISILSELSQRATDMESIKKTLATISQLSREGVSEIRSFMQSLDSTELSWNALAAELRKQGTSLLEPHHIRFTVETVVDDIHEQPGSLLWLSIIKIYKETLTNVIKHSRAGSVVVTLNITDRDFLLRVQDDGVGWTAAGHHGRGLPNMKRRAQEVGGKVMISVLEKGTQVSLEIPLPVTYSQTGMEL